jgi:hypothetical protein
MGMLSVNQVDHIHDLLVDKGVHYNSLRIELLDHVCCSIEEKMDCGWEFKKALEQSIQDFGPQGLARTNETTLYLLTLKLRKMKKVASVLGLLGGFLTVAGTVFKLMHWPGAGISLVLGIALIAVFYLPLMLTIQLKQTEDKWGKIAIITGTISAVVLAVATLFKIMHWPGAMALILLGMGMLSLLFMPMYFIRSYQVAENKMLKSSLVIVIFSGVVLFIGLTNMSDSRITELGHFAIEDRTQNMMKEASERNELIAKKLEMDRGVGAEQLTQIKAQTDALYNYLDKVRVTLIAETHDVSIDEAANMEANNIKHSISSGRIEEIMFAKSELSATAMKQKIEAYKNFVLQQFDASDRIAIENNMSLNTGKMLKTYDEYDTWEKANFTEKPLFYVLSYIDLLKTETRNTEGHVLMYLLGKNATAAR